MIAARDLVVSNRATFVIRERRAGARPDLASGIKSPKNRRRLPEQIRNRKYFIPPKAWAAFGQPGGAGFAVFSVGCAGFHCEMRAQKTASEKWKGAGL